MFKILCQKNIAININMPTYGLVCRENTDNIESKKGSNDSDK